jgi:flagellar hook assembly protein FlgD
VYDILGAEVRVLMDEVRDAGLQYAYWDGRNAFGAAASSGVYFYRVTTPERRATGKMVLLR